MTGKVGQIDALCDGRLNHDVTLVTDGAKYYTHSRATEQETMVARDGDRLDAACPVEGCGGHVDWDWNQITWYVDGQLYAQRMTRGFDWADMPDLTLTDTDQLEEWLRD